MFDEYLQVMVQVLARAELLLALSTRIACMAVNDRSG